MIYAISNVEWLDRHVSRWVDLARLSNAEEQFGLVLYGGGRRAGFGAVPDKFDAVKVLDSAGSRDEYNKVRMRLCEMMGDECAIYCDADADILEPIGGLREMVEGGEIGYVKSPQIHNEWVQACEKGGWNHREEGNNGLLVMRGDYGDRYEKAFKTAQGLGVNPRIIGTIAFNIMLNECAGHEIPYEYGVIWSDYGELRGAKIIQYCNQFGQKKREELEKWRRAGM